MATEFDLKSYFEARRLAVEEALEAALPAEDGLDARVVEAMRYSLFASGKRLRPILCLAARRRWAASCRMSWRQPALSR